VTFARERLSLDFAISCETKEIIAEIKNIFNPNALTLGFARRFATYKRPDLLLHNPERLLRLLSNPKRPVQLIIAGKAHPADLPGQALIQKWIRFIRRPEVRPHIIFLSDHDMLLTEQLVQGVDVWLNTPRRPWEACGTSGMKALVNGGINLSELDGWWAEAYTKDVGWALGDGQEHGDDPAWDAIEADALYDLLENEVIPKFYTRDQNGIPTAWITMMRESMGQLTPRFSANRVVREYVEKHYLPAASIYSNRAKNKGAIGAEIVNWHHALNQKWSALRFGELKIETDNKQHTFKIQIYFNVLDPNDVRVELYANGIDKAESVRIEMTLIQPLAGTSGCSVYSTTIPNSREVSDYTVRIIPHYSDVSVPLEDAHIIWQR
jgi:starch phosphorylase